MTILDHAPTEPPVNLPGGNPKPQPTPSSEAAPVVDFWAGQQAELHHQVFDLDADSLYPVPQDMWNGLTA